VKRTPAKAAVPRHVAVIMDGNGRWAEKKRLPRIEGHKRGAKAVEECMTAAAEAGVEYLTLYAFSVENWTRPRGEIRALMELLRGTLVRYEAKMMEEGVRLQAIGRLGDLPEGVRGQLERTMERTAGGRRLTLVLALSYGGRVEIVDACRSLAQEVRAGRLEPEAIDEKAVAARLYTRDIPDPDLLIRTSGEMRVSNFLLWQLSYTELFISPVLWPDFRKKHFLEALEDYRRRQRRFGAVAPAAGA
jgi:undecaprenyl diphosphate synthase